MSDTITEKTKVKDALREYPNLKEFMMQLTPKFKKLSNPLLLNTLARNADFEDVARMGGFSPCTLLEKINEFLGFSEKFREYKPCMKDQEGRLISENEQQNEKPEWLKNAFFVMTMDLRKRNDFFFTELIKKFQDMKKGEIFAIINDFDPLPLKKQALTYGLVYYTEYLDDGDVKVTFFKEREVARKDKKELSFSEIEYIDTHTMIDDPIYFVFSFAAQAKIGDKLIVDHDNEVFPLEKVLRRKGFNVNTKKKEDGRYQSEYVKSKEVTSNKPSMIIQSATPIFYPALVKLLQSDRFLDSVDLSIMRVWYETEKHLKWVNSGYADVSLSAVMVAAKFASNNLGVKLLSIDVWDNFYLLTRGYEAKSFHDVKGHTIVMPLFEKAPPASVTRYLIQKSGLDPNDFKFEYGTGVSKMGRPNNIEQGFKEGWLDTVLLRLPEASFTLNGVPDAHALSYGELWKSLHPGSRGLPNAGVVMKEEFMKKHPTETQIFVEELVNAVNWIKANPDEAAQMTAEIMNRTPSEVKDFIQKVNLTHVPTQDALEELKQYYSLLIDAGTMYMRTSLEEVLENLIVDYKKPE